MFLLGTFVNAVSVLLGTFIGIALPKIPEQMKTTVLQGLGLSVSIIGLSMSLKAGNDILIMIISLVFGIIIGEWLDIEGFLLRFGQWVESKFQRNGENRIAEAFVSASLIFCVGSMAILGAIQSGLANDHHLLYTKSMLDGFTSVVFSSTMGIGVGLAAIPIFLYQGLIALIAHVFGQVLYNPAIVNVVTATGGLMILAIGINILDIKKIRVGNMLPSLVIVAIVKWALLHLI
ncbi:DUF554 domain-containing protein [Fodinisporobacter ferrooxydans]|uniref:DUF554 domain-containing protein n=1 Tax=Fodinisporobacter ferrooxydans TaxID=2901836 RepID=A0ABY4CMQ5_9BACL|nr:DUF554 domain-containing protein [Alicyclobacillaceae bacterium MYW30-H2]